MRYKQGEQRDQMQFELLNMDMLIPEGHSCRLIDAFVEGLEMGKLGFKHAVPKAVGNRPYDPKMLLKLYLYGYQNRIRSSRRLQAESRRNIELMWLCENQKPDDKTISNFRHDNTKALKSAFRALCVMCGELELLGKEVIAVDGSKVRASQSKKRVYSRERLHEKMTKIDERIDEYLRELEQNDLRDRKEKKPDAREVQKAIEELEKRQAQYNELLREMEDSGESFISETDRDARLMKTGGDGRMSDACYNAQIAVDGKHGLIVAVEATQDANDMGKLHSMAQAAKDAMGVETVSALADTGYFDGEDIIAAEKAGTVCYVKNHRGGKRPPDDAYGIEHFRYDSAKDCYVCPESRELEYRGTHMYSGKRKRVYYDHAACAACGCRDKCTKGKHRMIRRLPEQEILDAVLERTERQRELYKKRGQIVEHPFGTLKAVWGYRQFLCRGLEKVGAELALACSAYNLRRIQTIMAG